MSYILDALKNSDKERKKGSVPDLQSQADRLLPPAPGPTRPGRRRVLVALPLLALAVAAVWLVQKTVLTDSAGPATPAAVAEPEISPPVIEAPPVEAEAPPVEAEAPPAETDIPTAPVSVDDDYLDELRDVRLDVAPVVEEEAFESPAPEPAAAEPPAVASEEPVIETAPAPEPAPVDPVADQPAEETTAAAVTDPYEGILHQYQLPPDVQRALPELEITVHIYSATPSSRLVRINRRTLQEGEEVEDNLTLEEITPDGLILSFGDQRYWRYVN